MPNAAPRKNRLSSRRRTTALLLLGALGVTGTAVAALTRAGAHRRPPGPPSAPEGNVSPEIPRARWRLANIAELDRVVLFVSHILVRHSEAEAEHVPFDLGGWTRMTPPSGRSRAEARQLAQQLAAQARAQPAGFAVLAAERSEDDVRRAVGGSLGGVIATDLVAWPQVLDAIAPLADGAISEVVETSFGFHVFRKNPPPPAQPIAARRLVIGYDQAAFLSVVARVGRPRVTRSRAEALAFASSLAARARQAPVALSALIDAHSEHRDAAEGGDLGVWSNREPSGLPRELEALSAMTVGQISEPFDSQFGFEILQRTPVSERPAYAMAAIRLPYDPAAPDAEPTSRSAIRRAAAQLIAALQRDPAQMAALQRQAGSIESETWSAGRGPFGLTPWLTRLAIGDLSASPADSPPFIVIARRLDPASVPAPLAPRFVLPAPVAPDMRYFISSRRGADLARMVRTVAQESSRLLPSGDPRAARLADAHAALASAFETVDDDAVVRLDRYDQAMAAVAQLLGRGEFDRYSSVVHAHIEGAILRGRR